MDALPGRIEKAGDSEIRIAWSDGHESRFPARRLRLSCPCAHCKDEWTGKPLLAPGSVPEDVAVLRADIVGQYALAFRFSDGHSTGIYTFDMLRGSCPCPGCARSAGG